MKTRNKHSIYNDYFENDSPLANCLEPLLNGLGWHGNKRRIIEALPHFHKELTLTDFTTILNEFDIESSKKLIIKNGINKNLIPCILENNNNYYLVLEELGEEKGYKLLDARTSETIIIKQLSGKAITFKKKSASNIKFSLFNLIRTNTIVKIFIAALFINIFTITTPFFIMTVYDKVILSESKELLIYLCFGMIIILSSSFLLQKFKNNLLARSGTAINEEINNKVFNKIISLQLNKIENASLGTQIAKLKEFDSLRDFITGPLISLSTDIPYTILFLMAISFIATPLIIIPIAAILLMLAIGFISHKAISSMIKTSSSLSTNRQEFIIETLNNLEQILYSGSSKIWEKRYEKISAKTAINNYKGSMLSSFLNTASETIMFSSALATISLGVLMTMNNQISIGGLIAIMMLIWKVLSPIKSLQTNMPRLIQVNSSLKKLKSLFEIENETNLSKHRIFSTNISGKIKFHRISLIYKRNSEPALSNINFSINPCELVMIGGHNGSGKSSIFKLITKLYSPVSGSIYIDDKDIRQINTQELRQLIGYVPQKNHFFYGTISQNLKLSNPFANELDIISALTSTNLFDEIQLLPEKLETRMKDDYQQVFSSSFLQRLAIARALIKKPKLLLLDEPAEHLDSKSEKVLLNSILKMKNEISVLMISHRPSHFKLADRILILKNGFCEIKENNNSIKKAAY